MIQDTRYMMNVTRHMLHADKEDKDGMILFDLSYIFLVFGNSLLIQLNFQITLTTEAGILYQFQIHFDSTLYSEKNYNVFHTWLH